METFCRQCSETMKHVGDFFASLPALRLPFIPPTSLPLFPARLAVVTTQASQECLQMFSLYDSHTHFLFCAHTQHETHIVLTSGGSLYLTFALKIPTVNRSRNRSSLHLFFMLFIRNYKPKLTSDQCFTAGQPCRPISIS